jgi:hypothetical protein
LIHIFTYTYLFFFCEWVLFETADGLVNRTGRGGENYGESSANNSLLHPAAPAVRQHPEGWLHDRRLRRAACRTGNDADLRAPYWPEFTYHSRFIRISRENPRNYSVTSKFYQNYLLTRNTANVTGGKYIAVRSHSISGASAVNPLLAFYDIYQRKGEVLFFLSRTPHARSIFLMEKNLMSVRFGETLCRVCFQWSLSRRRGWTCQCCCWLIYSLIVAPAIQMCVNCAYANCQDVKLYEYDSCESLYYNIRICKTYFKIVRVVWCPDKIK